MTGKPHSRAESAQARQSRIAELRAAEQRATRRRRAAVSIAVAAVLAVVVGAVVLGSRSGSNPAPVASTSLPPWSVPADPIAAARAAGLVVNPMEGAVQHFHAHLDVIVDGKAVPVPANLGINTFAGQYAEMHTHDTSGVLHVESASADEKFTLGQLFTEWGVRFDATHLGGLTSADGTPLKVYLDGKRVTTDPAQLTLASHQEIAVVYGADPAPVPSTYSWPADLPV